MPPAGNGRVAFAPSPRATAMRGLFPGRFQPFHSGHHKTVERIAEDVEEVVVGIGSAQASHTGRNPFTAGERVSMIHGALDEMATTTYAIPLQDTKRYALWPAHVRSLCPPFEAVYTNNPIVGRVCREAGLEVREVELFDREHYRGTAVRRRVVEGDRWRHLLPDPVVAVIEEVDGADRLRAIVEHDQHAVDREP